MVTAPRSKRFARWAVILVMLAISIRILLSGTDFGHARLEITLTSDVAGFSQLFIADEPAGFTEEASVRSDLVTGRQVLSFRFGVLDGLWGREARWDPANYPANVEVFALRVRDAGGVHDLPLTELRPALDLVRFEQVGNTVVVQTGSYDGQTLLMADLGAVALRHEVALAAVSGLLAVLICGLVVAGRAWRRGRPRRGGESLQSAFDPRRNALNFIRLVLAGLVIASHSDSIAGYTDSHQMGFLGEGLVVDTFFGLSGFLMARTLSRRPQWLTYLWHRTVRLFPAFLVAAAWVALVFAPLAHVIWPSYQPAPFGEMDGAWGYIWRNSSLWLVQPGIAGGPTVVSVEGSWNGSIWTMGWTLWCDLGLVLLVVLGVLGKRPWIVLAIAWLSWVGLAGSVWNPEIGLGPEWWIPLRFSLLFSLGVLAFLWGDRIPMRWFLALGALVAVVVSDRALDADYRVLGAPFMVYLALWLSSRLPIRTGSRNDLSYGIYLFGYPVQQVMAMAGLASLGWWAFTIGAMALSVPFAAMSWHLVEKQGMRLRTWTVPGAIEKSRAMTLRGVVPAVSLSLFVAYSAIWLLFVQAAR